MGWLPSPKPMKNRMKKVKITVSNSSLLPTPTMTARYPSLLTCSNYSMHPAGVSRPCLWALSLETICSNFPSSSFQVFSDRAAQALTIQVACAFEQLVVLFKHWLDDFPPCSSSARLEEELRQDIKKLGGYLQLFLQVSWLVVFEEFICSKSIYWLPTTCISPDITSEDFWVLPVLRS